jgi:hypothetical protein
MAECPSFRSFCEKGGIRHCILSIFRPTRHVSGHYLNVLHETFLLTFSDQSLALIVNENVFNATSRQDARPFRCRACALHQGQENSCSPNTEYWWKKHPRLDRSRNRSRPPAPTQNCQWQENAVQKEAVSAQQSAVSKNKAENAGEGACAPEEEKITDWPFANC